MANIWACNEVRMNLPHGLRVLLESMHFQLKFASSAIIGGTKDEIYLFSQKAPLPRPFSQAGQSQSTNTPLHYPSQRGSGEYPSACLFSPNQPLFSTTTQISTSSSSSPWMGSAEERKKLKLITSLSTLYYDCVADNWPAAAASPLSARWMACVPQEPKTILSAGYNCCLDGLLRVPEAGRG